MIGPDTENGIIRRYINILQLSDSVLEAARYNAEHSSAELLGDITAAVSTIKDNFSQLKEEPTKNYALYNKHLTAYIKSANPDVKSMPDIVFTWRGAIYHMVFEGSFQSHASNAPSLTYDNAEDLFKIIADAPFNNKSKSILWLQTAFKSGYTAPALSFEYMMNAFSGAPDIGTFFEHIKKPDYRFEQEKHPQRCFESCPICGGTGTPHYNACSYLALDFSESFYPAKLWMKCEKCHNLYTRYFPESFLASAGQRVETVTPHSDPTKVSRPQRQSIWGNILNAISAYTTGREILEVGIGEGEFIAAALEMGYRVDGIEIGVTVAQRVADILDINIICGNFLEFETNKRYSIIFMGDVLEHLSDPIFALRKAHDLLEKEGILWLSTPNYQSGFSRCMKYTDPMWLEPTHVTYFSGEGLVKAVEACGFDILNYSISARYNGSMELILRKK